MYFVGCNEYETATNFYEHQLVENLQGLNNPNEMEKRIQQIIKSGAETVRFMQERDPYIGGTIRYAIIQNTHSYIEENFID